MASTAVKYEKGLKKGEGGKRKRGAENGRGKWEERMGRAGKKQMRGGERRGGREN